MTPAEQRREAAEQRQEEVRQEAAKEAAKEAASIKLAIRIAIGLVIGLIGVLWLFTSCVKAWPGEVKVVMHMGKTTGATIPMGTQFIPPFGYGTTATYSVKEQVIDVEDPSSGTKDLQAVKVEVRVNYRLLNVVEVHKRFGQDYADIALVKAMTETIKTVTAQHSVEELIQRRLEVSKEMSTHFTRTIDESYAGLFQIVTFSITDMMPSRTFMASVEAKQVAEQEAMKTRNEVEQTKAQAMKDEAEAVGFANARKARAEGEAVAMLTEATAQAEAIRLVGTALKEYPEMLTMRGLDVWDGQLPKVVGETGIILDKLLEDKD